MDLKGKTVPTINQITILAEADATTLFSTMAIMMALETGKVNLLDTIDVGNGIYITDSSDSIKDGNWQRGGYGAITVGRRNNGKLTSFYYLIYREGVWKRKRILL